jgi:hypothetical protein
MENKMKTIINKSLITIALIITFSLSGCGGGGGGATAGGGSGGGGSTTATADAGSDQLAARASTVTLNGSSSSDSSGAALSYEWQQTRGSDVTGGTGVLTGANPSFNAPGSVETLTFSLSVNGSAADTVHVNVLEHSGSAFFVDGDSGSDGSGDGSMDNPYASISHAIGQIAANNTDIYVRTLATRRYDETGATLAPPAATSLYGGYGAEWVRDVENNRTGVDGNSIALHFNDVASEAWVSGFDLMAADSANGSSDVNGISTTAGSASLVIEDNTITAGDVGAGSGDPTGNSIALRLANINGVQVLRNTISAGLGGSGADGAKPSQSQKGGNGGNGGTPTAGTGGAASNTNSFGNAGGAGGRGGETAGENGDAGSPGSALTDSTGGGSGGAGGFGGGSTNIGGPGGGGRGSVGGPGGDGGDGIGGISTSGVYTAANGRRGFDGNSATGGGGGGGGEAGGLGADAGGGGGGGGGGFRGIGGSGGRGGGASIGLMIHGISVATVSENTITSSAGGDGGNGGAGGDSGNGGDGGNPGPGDSTGEDGGHGGGGGKGGEGGQGGGGGGGPSFAILIGDDISPEISNNTLSSGNGRSRGSGGLGGREGATGRNGSGIVAPGLGATTYLNNRGSFGLTASDGWSYGIFDIDPNDGLVPVMSGNTITAGAAGSNGQAGESNF